jgi:hypothetical protein
MIALFASFSGADCQSAVKLLLPLRHLVRMHVVPRRDLIDRLLGFDRFQGDLRLKLACEFPSPPLASFQWVHFQCAFYLSHWSYFWGALHLRVRVNWREFVVFPNSRTIVCRKSILRRLDFMAPHFSAR